MRDLRTSSGTSYFCLAPAAAAAAVTVRARVYPHPTRARGVDHAQWQSKPCSPASVGGFLPTGACGCLSPRGLERPLRGLVGIVAPPRKSRTAVPFWISIRLTIYRYLSFTSVVVCGGGPRGRYYTFRQLVPAWRPAPPGLPDPGQRIPGRTTRNGEGG